MKFLSDILAKAGLTVDGVVTLNNTATGQTPNANDNSTKLATTAWVRTFVQPYSLPIATSSVLGGIKVGTGLSIDAGTGVLSVSGGGAASIKSTQTFTATAGQTVFTISGGYIVGLIDVFLNGVYLSPNQTTATNGTTITLGDAALAGDIIDVIIASPVYQGATTTTDQLSEGSTNLYFTNARARAAISESVTGLDYNSATGVLSITTGYGIPTTASQTTWDAAYNDKINSAAVTGTTTKTLTLTQQDGGTITASWTDDNTDAVTSVFGRTGAVVAVSGDYTTAQVTEVTNLYYTDARARAAISVTGSGSYNSATGVITVTGGVTSVNTLTGAVTLTTTNIGEGTNLYYTTARANSDFDTRLGTKSTTNLAEGTNLYYTTARANSDFDTRLATKSTTNLAEGTNLYYTDTRVGTYLTGNSYATQSYVSTQINNLVSGAPGLLDTLDELAAALGDDPNFATTVSTALGNRLRIDIGTQGLTGTQQGYGRTNLGLGSLSTLSSIGDAYITDLAYSKLTGVPSTFAPSAHTHDDRYYTETEIGNFFSGASVITGYNKTNWDTAYGWGNHASGGYLTTASAASTYVSLSGSYANPSWITSLAYSKITGVPAFITSYTEVDTLATVTARGATTSTNSIFSGGLQSRKNQTDNNYTTAALWTESFGTTTTGIAFHISGVVGKFLEMRTNGTLYWENNQVWTSGTLTNLNQLTNGPGYVTDLSGYVTLASVQTITGKKTFSNAFGDSDPVVAFTGTSSASFQYITTAYNASISAGQTIAHFIGRASSSRMSAYIGYQYAASDSNSNFLTLGHWGYDHLIKLYPTGQTIISGALSASNISSSVTASYIVQRDANGYIYANHVNFSTTESENPVISSFITSNGDGWSRKSSLAHVRSQLGNYGGWITGYTETDTLASVTSRGASTSTALSLNGGVIITGPNAWNAATPMLNIGGSGDGRLQVRHIWGKEAGTASPDHLWLQYTNSTFGVQIGANGGSNPLYVAGDIYMGGYFTGSLVATRTWVTSQGYITGYTETDTLASVTGRGASTTAGINVNGRLTAAGGGTYAVTGSSTQRYIMQALNTSNSVNAAYGWWWYHNANGDMGFHADAVGDILNITRGGGVTVNGNTILTAGNYNSYALPLAGGVMTGALVNNTDGAVLMESNASENNNWLWKEAAKQWGLFWFNRGSQSGQTIGTYSTIGAELMFMGGSSGIAMPSGWTGYIAGSNIAAMISNWNGYIYSASTIYAATSMIVGGNTVYHTGNLPTIPTNNNQLTNGANYITSAATVAGLNTTFLGTGSTNIDSGYSRVVRNENGAGGNPTYAPVLHLAASDTMWQIAAGHGGQTNLVWRSGYAGTWATPWWTVWHSGNDGAGSGLDADLLDGLSTGTSTNNIPFLNGSRNLIINDPESYSGEVRLGAAWSRAGVYASNTLSMSTSSGNINFVSNDATIGGFRYDSTNGTRFIVGLDGNVATPYTLVDANKRPIMYARGPYPVLVLDHTDPSNTNHGPTIQFAFNGSDQRQWVIGASGNGSRLDFGMSNTAYGNTNYNPHNGIAGYQGKTVMRITEGGVAIGSLGTYPTINSPAYELDVRGNMRATGIIYANSYLVTPTIYSGGGSISFGNNVANTIIAPTSASWAEGLSFTMPSTTTWGGLRWRRERGNNDGNWYIGFTALDATDDLVFGANNGGTQVDNIIRLTKAGNVSTSGSFTVAGTSTLNSQVNINRHIDANTAWGSCTSIFVGWSSGKVILGNGNSGGHDYALNLGCNTIVSTNPFYCYQDITAYSDSRVKDNVEKVEDAIEKIKSIRGVTFTRNDIPDINKRHAGVIAQEVLAVLPEVVTEDDRGHYSVAYGNLSALLIEAIKEQQVQIESQKSEIEELKDLVQQLINR